MPHMGLMALFVHLHCHSYFSFLDGASTVQEIVSQAAQQGMTALALTDHDTIAGLPAFHKWARKYGIQPVSGAEVTLEDGSHLTLLCETKTGYANLCTLLTHAHAGGQRRRPSIPESLLFQHSEGLIALSGCRRGKIPRMLQSGARDSAHRTAAAYRDAFPGSFFIELHTDERPDTEWLNGRLAELAAQLDIQTVATGNVHHHVPQRMQTHDILTCMRLKIDVATAHAQRPINDARFLFDHAEALRRLRSFPDAVERTSSLARRCDIALELGQALFPAFPNADGLGNEESLRSLVYSGAKRRYPRVDAALRARIDHELDVIIRLGYTDYFLLVHDIARHARESGIRYAGRGSAADSAAAYCLYITDVDAAGRGLLFERFMSMERAERPDIDIDFDARRRDEIIAYVYQTYGPAHVARVATLQTFQGRGALREVGAALGIPQGVLDVLAKRVPWSARADRLESLFERVPELRELSGFRDQLRWLWPIAEQLAGFPRHLGMHSGGIVISTRPLLEFTSLQPSGKGDLILPWDKYDVEDVGLVKLDLLSLRTFSAISDAVVSRRKLGFELDYDGIPLDDAATFSMINRGETVGAFQLESPAQRALQSRLNADGLEDIVASVALIRPGPIKGDMVEPFILRRQGREAVSYLHPKLEPILRKTYGVILYQEQVIAIATALANFSPGEADQLRRVMSHARSGAEMARIGERFIASAVAAGVDRETASTVFRAMEGYASYGFCEAHAAAFSVTAYRTAYLIHHYPAEFYAAILSNYPMGYYPVHIICAEARRRGVAIRGVDVNSSEWGSTVESDTAIRLGFSLLAGFPHAVWCAVEQARTANAPFASLQDFLKRVPSADILVTERLIRVGAFESLHKGQRKALLWSLPELCATSRENQDAPRIITMHSVPLAAQGETDDTALPERLRDEYELLGVGVSGHWLDLIRARLTAERYVRIEQLRELAENAVVKLAGLTVRPHRPPTKSGKTTVFFTLEDETGIVDCTMFESVYHRSKGLLFTPQGRVIGLKGRLVRRGGALAQIVVSAMWPLP